MRLPDQRIHDYAQPHNRRGFINGLPSNPATLKTQRACGEKGGSSNAPSIYGSLPGKTAAREART